MLLLPTAYLPPVSWFKACAAADEILIEAWETYPKQTIRNHCEIGGPNGRQRLTIPVTKPNGNHTLTKEIRITSHLPWQKIHWRSFEAAYNKSPFFLYYRDYLLPFYEREFDFLLDFNMELTDVLFQAIRMDKPISLTQTFEKNPEEIKDLRYPASGARHLATPGRGLLFAPTSGIWNPEAGSRLAAYYQVFGDRHGFLKDLSIVDLLFNMGPEASQYLESTEG